MPYTPGNEPEELKRHLNVLLKDLHQNFPDGLIIMDMWNHERWDRVAGYLTKNLGYPNGRSFLEAYGFEVFVGEDEDVEEKSSSNSKPQQVEITKISVKKSTKKTITSIIVVILVLAIGIGAYFYISNMQAKKNAEQALKSYKANLSIIRISMLTGAIDAEDAGGLIHDVWYNSIYEKRDSNTDKYTRNGSSWVDDFNVALNNLFKDSSFKAKIETIKDNQSDVSDTMKKLVNPPSEYQEAYGVLKQLYDAYTELCNCAVNPTGNLSSYTSTFNSADNNFLKYYDSLSLYID
jgi:hypothetical protein